MFKSNRQIQIELHVLFCFALLHDRENWKLGGSGGRKSLVEGGRKEGIWLKYIGGNYQRQCNIIFKKQKNILVVDISRQALMSLMNGKKKTFTSFCTFCFSCCSKDSQINGNDLLNFIDICYNIHFLISAIINFGLFLFLYIEYVHFIQFLFILFLFKELFVHWFIILFFFTSVISSQISVFFYILLLTLTVLAFLWLWYTLSYSFDVHNF